LVAPGYKIVGLEDEAIPFGLINGQTAVIWSVTFRPVASLFFSPTLQPKTMSSKGAVISRDPNLFATIVATKGEDERIEL
jgi:hypothetical protein